MEFVDDFMNSISNNTVRAFCLFIFNNRNLGNSNSPMKLDFMKLETEYMDDPPFNSYCNFTLEFKNKTIFGEIGCIWSEDITTIECFDITDGGRTLINTDSRIREFFGINAINPLKPTKSARIIFCQN